MKIALSTPGGVAFLAFALASAPAAARELSYAVPAGGLVLDGGDLEAPAPGEGLLEALPDASTPRPILASAAAASDPPAAVAARPVAFEYSDGYYERLEVHKYASYATVPLFITQVILGEKLKDGAGDGTRTAHTAVAIATGALFAVNTVTGGMNLWEGRRDPNRKTRTRVHGILMMVADAGFVATGLLAPDDEGGGDSSTHRAVALGSMGVAMIAYLTMIIGR